MSRASFLVSQIIANNKHWTTRAWWHLAQELGMEYGLMLQAADWYIHRRPGQALSMRLSRVAEEAVEIMARELGWFRK
jgi:hypothetical protein